MSDTVNARLHEKIADPGHRFAAHVSEIWDGARNLVVESHFGNIIEVTRDPAGALRVAPAKKE